MRGVHQGMDTQTIEAQVRKLHEAVWDDDVEGLEALLVENKGKEVINSKKEMIPFIDGKYRGATVLGLAAQLGRSNCIKILLKHWADTLEASEIGYYPLQEATSLGDRDIMKMLLLRRHEQMRQLWKIRQPDLFAALRYQLGDFFLEMDWHFKSWIPFLSRFCPSDRCRIWKRGSRLRVDSTLMGVEMQNLSWKVGNVSFIFDIGETGSNMYALDHDQQLYEEIDKTRDYTEAEIEEDLNMRLNVQIYTTKVRKPKDELGRKKVQFLRKQAGFFGLGGDLQEQVGVYNTDVYDVPNIELVTRYRREHLMARERVDTSSNSGAKEEELTESLASEEVLGEINDYQTKIDGNYLQSSYKSLLMHTPSLPPPSPLPQLSREQYFPSQTQKHDKEETSYLHVGRPILETSKSKKFRVTLWMAKDFPMTVEQLMPFFELMTIGNQNFRKVQEFISMELPPGFPVKIEIPLFAFLSAQITFLNLAMWTEATIPKPKFAATDDPRDWFTIPSNYRPGKVIKSILGEEE